MNQTPDTPPQDPGKASAYPSQPPRDHWSVSSVDEPGIDPDPYTGGNRQCRRKSRATMQIVLGCISVAMIAGGSWLVWNAVSQKSQQEPPRSPETSLQESLQSPETAAPAPEQPAVNETAAPETPAASISSGFADAGTADYVVVYQAPDTGSSAVARAYTGDPIEIFALQGQWYQIKLGDLTGYIKAEQVSFSEPVPQTEAVTEAAEAPAATSADPPTVNVNIILQYDSDGIALPKSYTSYEAYAGGKEGYCCVDSCYIYKTASMSGPKRQADMLYKNDALTVYGFYDGFYYIGTDSGSGYELMGYVQTDMITIGTPPPQEGKSYTATAGYVKVKSCKVRSSPTKEDDSNIIDEIYNGTTFTINSFDGYWYSINYDGKTGYVSHKMVTVY